MATIKTNLLYNAILTLSGYIFPLMVYPYVSRVLGVDNMGACNFVDSIVEYFTIFSMLGMNTVGIREIAKNKGNQEALDKTFSQLFSLNTITTLLAVVCLVIATFTVPKFADYKALLYIGVGKLFFNYMLINWFFQGLENFKYIAARTIFVKILFVISVFLFVKDADDVKMYYLLVALTWAGNGIVNSFYARKFVKFHFTFKIEKTIVSSVLILGCYWLMNSMYTTLNVAYLGFISNDTEVGYYTTANKLLAVIMAMFTTFTSVMVPRISSTLNNNTNDYTEFIALIQKAIQALLIFAIPLMYFVFSNSGELIQLMAGKGYEGAIIPLQIMAPLFFLIGYDQIIVLQSLLPLGKDHDILRNSIIAAFVGVMANVILTTSLGKIGSSVVLIIAELTVLTTSQICIQKYVNIKFPFEETAKYIILMSPILMISIVVKYIIPNWIAALTISAILTILYVGFIGYYSTKNSIIVNIIDNIKNKLYL